MADSFGCALMRTQDQVYALKNTIRLRSGGYFSFSNPQPDQFTLEDISAALSKVCRFGGHCNHFYSVAEHLIHATNQAIEDGHPLEVQKAVFMHDATEAFVGDLVRPLKVLVPEYQAVEARVEAVIGQKFGIDFAAHHEVVKGLDNAMLLAERDLLFTRDSVKWGGEEQWRRLEVDFQWWGPSQAERQFNKMARKLGV